MRWVADHRRRTKLVGLLCAVGAVGLGLAYLAAAGAPARYVALNLAALLVGLAAFATVNVPNWRTGGGRDFLLPGLGALLLATALSGTPVEGASRWVAIGPLNLQTSLILLPAMLVRFASHPRTSGAAGMLLAALALALQPDRAMAGTLAAGLAALALCRRERPVLLALAASLAAFAATLARPDALPAVPYVDRIFYSAFDIHPLAGIAVTGGACLLVVPALSGLSGGAAHREAAFVFGASWLAIAIAAALGNYPTPLVGYGGSAIVGYLLSLALLPSREASETGRERGSRRSETGHDPTLFESLAQPRDSRVATAVVQASRRSNVIRALP